MGFIPLPLGVVTARVLCTNLPVTPKLSYFLLLFLAYLILITLHILINIIILGHANDVIKKYMQGSGSYHKNKASTVGTAYARWGNFQSRFRYYNFIE